jgi:hypothetical protein
VKLLDGPSELPVCVFEERLRFGLNRPLGKRTAFAQTVGEHVEALSGALMEPAL